MRRKNSRRNQKLYKMKGCSKSKTYKKYLGGSAADVNLAYPSNNVQTSPNPFLAYTGKGGSSAAMVPQNISSAYPSTGPPSTGFNFLNPQTQKGGCGCGIQLGGNNNHRVGCKCSSCKLLSMAGGSYPNGLVGSHWTPSVSGWPGVDGISGDRNSYSLNTYSPNDVSRQMVNVGANPPFSIGGTKSRKSKNIYKKHNHKDNKKNHKKEEHYPTFWVKI
jgi:hypothetical protein